MRFLTLILCELCRLTVILQMQWRRIWRKCAKIGPGRCPQRRCSRRGLRWGSEAKLPEAENSTDFQKFPAQKCSLWNSINSRNRFNTYLQKFQQNLWTIYSLRATTKPRIEKILLFTCYSVSKGINTVEIHIYMEFVGSCNSMCVPTGCPATIHRVCPCQMLHDV